MKELTQEQKAKAYDEAIYIAKGLYNKCKTGTQNAFHRADIERMFPELMESEDESIRKDLLSWLKGKDGQTLPIDKYNAAITWLEKQSEEARKIALRTEYEKGRADAIAEVSKFKVKYAGSEYNVLEIKDIAGVIFYGIEDEPNHIDYVKAENCKIIGGYTIKENGSPYPTKPAVFSEQNPIDKAEPKFHKGDWVVFDCGEESRTLQIKEIIVKEYVFTDDTRLDVVDEDSLHLWTINDAKDGDILAEDACTFIIKKLNQDNSAEIYCCLHYNSDFFAQSKLVFDYTSTYPATKEQRDTLTKAMADAGYTFDFEKKELKKIEDKPLVIDEGKDEIDRSFTKMMLKGYNRQKPAWSREDEQNLNAALGYIDDEYLRRWLKDVIYNKYENSSKWSQEDEKMCQETIDWFEKKCFPYALESENPARESIDWLKSLKDRVILQNTWKPSDEQITELHRVISGCSYDIEPLAEMAEQLKKLKEE